LSTLSNFLAHKPDSILEYHPSYDNVLGNAT
jgi:hypothetical protein